MAVSFVGILKEARLATSRFFTLADFQGALDLVSAGQVAVHPLIQGKTLFDRLGEDQGRPAMELARRAVRLLVRMGGDDSVQFLRAQRAKMR